MKNKSAPISVPVFALVFGSVLFADFIPSVFGAYANQRVLLSLLLIATVVLGIGRLSYKGRLTSAFLDLLPIFLFMISIVVTVFQYHSEPFYLVEPVFYSLYFLAFVVGGHVFQTERKTWEIVQALVMVAAVTCFF